MKLLALIVVIVGSVLLANALMTPLSVRTWGERTYRYGEKRLKNAVLSHDGSMIPFGSLSEEFTYPAKVHGEMQSNFNDVCMIILLSFLAEREQLHQHHLDQRDRSAERSEVTAGGHPERRCWLSVCYVAGEGTAPSRLQYARRYFRITTTKYPNKRPFQFLEIRISSL